jgi:5-methylcytosine-specific restriction endonuclease McrA
MPYGNPYRHPTFEKIRDKYRNLKEPFADAIYELEEFRESIWKQSPIHHALDYIYRMPEIPGWISFYAGLLLLFLVVEAGYDLFLLLLLALVLYNVAPACARLIERKTRPLVIARHRTEILPYEKKVERARATLARINESYAIEWSNACDSFSDYPPDWGERCAIVKERDGHKCTQCGYPDGFRRRSRELHVHHVVPLAKGGTNEITNLITLCHVCHRKVGTGHAGVRKLRTAKRK